jgi:hypothetical protein
LKSTNCAAFFFIKIYLQDVNKYTSVPDSIKLFLVNQFTCRTLAVRGGHGAITSGDGRYSSEKIGTKEKTRAALVLSVTSSFSKCFPFGVYGKRGEQTENRC